MIMNASSLSHLRHGHLSSLSLVNPLCLLLFLWCKHPLKFMQRYNEIVDMFLWIKILLCLYPIFYVTCYDSSHSSVAAHKTFMIAVRRYWLPFNCHNATSRTEEGFIFPSSSINSALKWHCYGIHCIGNFFPTIMVSRPRFAMMICSHKNPIDSHSHYNIISFTSLPRQSPYPNFHTDLMIYLGLPSKALCKSSSCKKSKCTWENKLTIVCIIKHQHDAEMSRLKNEWTTSPNEILILYFLFHIYSYPPMQTFCNTDYGHGRPFLLLLQTSASETLTKKHHALYMRSSQTKLRGVTSVSISHQLFSTMRHSASCACAHFKAID